MSCKSSRTVSVGYERYEIGVLFLNPLKINEIVNARMAVNLVEELVKLADAGAIFTIKSTRDLGCTQGWLGGASCCLLQASCHWTL